MEFLCRNLITDMDMDDMDTKNIMMTTDMDIVRHETFLIDCEMRLLPLLEEYEL